MARIKMKFAADGNSFKVANVCSTDSKDCVGEFKKFVKGACEFDENEVQHTEEYYAHDELPPQVEHVGELNPDDGQD
jgi:uncharacterized protein (UPF0333 family)